MALNWDEHNLYELLEVSGEASATEIHNAFRRAKATYGNDNPALYGMFTRDEAIQLIKFSTHDFIRRQEVWFRGHDNGILWHNIEELQSSQLIAEIANCKM